MNSERKTYTSRHEIMNIFSFFPTNSPSGRTLNCPVQGYLFVNINLYNFKAVHAVIFLTVSGLRVVSGCLETIFCDMSKDRYPSILVSTSCLCCLGDNVLRCYLSRF